MIQNLQIGVIAIVKEIMEEEHIVMETIIVKNALAKYLLKIINMVLRIYYWLLKFILRLDFFDFKKKIININ